MLCHVALRPAPFPARRPGAPGSHGGVRGRGARVPRSAPPAAAFHGPAPTRAVVQGPPGCPRDGSGLAAGPPRAAAFGPGPQPPGRSQKLREMLVAAELRGRRGGDVAGEQCGGARAWAGPRGWTRQRWQLHRALHHFRSPRFCRGRPDLLVHLKRLTKGNRAKMAAGLAVTSRPPNRFQRLLGTPLNGQPLPPPSTLSNANRPGLLTVGQFHQLYGQGVFSPYSYMATSCQAPSTLPAQRLDATPVPSTWIQ
ncbi:heat shock factor protein 5-like [Falco naumanni]|nr:heat shock factor protein 5-like [Falco naumanni]